MFCSSGTRFWNSLTCAFVSLYLSHLCNWKSAGQRKELKKCSCRLDRTAIENKGMSEGWIKKRKTVNYIKCYIKWYISKHRRDEYHKPEVWLLSESVSCLSNDWSESFSRRFCNSRSSEKFLLVLQPDSKCTFGLPSVSVTLSVWPWDSRFGLKFSSGGKAKKDNYES